MYAVRYVSVAGIDCLRIGFKSEEDASTWLKNKYIGNKLTAYVTVPDMITFNGLIILHKD
jgi:hypothetical protein